MYIYVYACTNNGAMYSGAMYIYVYPCTNNGAMYSTSTSFEAFVIHTLIKSSIHRHAG
jgi:hypothetical protein